MCPSAVLKLSFLSSCVRGRRLRLRRFLSETSDSVEEVEAERGGDVQRLQAQGRRRVREQDRERVLGVHQELLRIASLLRTVLDTQRHTTEFKNSN